MTDSLFSGFSGGRYALRRHLRQDAARAATCIIWSLYSPAEALEELRGQAFMLAQRVGAAKLPSDALAREMLVEEYHSQMALHALTGAAIRDAAVAAIRAGASRPDVASAGATVAKAAPLPPPPYVVTGALDQAVKEVRFAEAWWKRRKMA